MGVPSFFRWLSRKYPKIISPVIEEQPQVIDGVTLPLDYASPNPNGELDNLYLDMNGIVHPCSHPENGPAPETEDEMLLAVFEYTNRVLNMARPRKVLVMAVDGVAPRAKMNQQRSRRFRSARDAAIENETREEILRRREEEFGEIINDSVKNKKAWDSNAITPGTPFMDKLAAGLRYWTAFKLATDPGWKNLQVIISDATVPGEGEHKIMNFVRSQRADPQYNPNTTHCIYGLDADLIFLGLATHEPHFKILREDVFAQQDNRKYKSKIKDSLEMSEEEKQLMQKQNSQKPFLWLHINVLREYLSAELWIARLPFTFDLERAIDDWVFMCFFCGNDFLPHLPSLDVRENSIDILLDIWKAVLPSMKTYLTCDGDLNLESVEKLLRQLGARESDIFKTRHIQEVRKLESMKMRKLQKQNNVSAGQDRHPTVADEQMLMYDTNGGLAKGSWNLTTHDMVKFKKELMLANEGNAEAIAIIQAQSDKNNKLMQEITEEQMDKVIADANKQNMTAAEAMKKRLIAKKRRLEAEENKISGDISKKPKTEDPPNDELEEKIHKDIEESVANEADNDENIDTPDIPKPQEGPVRSGVFDTDEQVRLYEPGYRERYYMAKLNVKASDVDAIAKDMVKCYIEGVSWVLAYYYQGCASWDWFYPYHYAPFAFDFQEIANLKITFELGEPFLPFEQLMSVLPAASGHALPPIFRKLMSEPDSEIIEFYPSEFPIDMNGKKMSWQGIALLPFIEASKLLRVVRDQYPKLTEAEAARNVRRDAILLISNKNVNYDKFAKKLYTNGPCDRLEFEHFKSGLCGIVATDTEGFQLNGKMQCPVQGGAFTELSTNLLLKMSYKLFELPGKNKSVILNGFIPPHAMLSQHELEDVMYKQSSYNRRRWNFSDEMQQNIVIVGPEGTSQYRPRPGGYKSLLYFEHQQQQQQQQQSIIPSAARYPNNGSVQDGNYSHAQGHHSQGFSRSYGPGRRDNYSARGGSGRAGGPNRGYSNYNQRYNGPSRYQS